MNLAGMSDERVSEKKVKNTMEGVNLTEILQWSGIAFTQFSSLLLPLHVFVKVSNYHEMF